MTDSVKGLVLGCHPLPCLLVMSFAAAYAAVIGAGAGRVAAVAGAILSGQLCVGWSNDLIDAGRDRAAGRHDKPLAAGLVSRRTMLLALIVAACACLVLSLRLGAMAATVHGVAIASAIAYNAGLKGTAASPLPYLLSFGLLPAVVTSAVQNAWPPPAHMIAAALLGFAAHFGNTVGDTAADTLTGVRGLPQRLGPLRSLVVMAGFVALAALVLLVQILASGDGAAGGRRAGAAALLVAGVVLAVAGAVRHVGVPGGSSAFRLTLAAVTLVVAGFLAAV